MPVSHRRLFEGDFVCHLYSLGDMVADVVGTDKTVDSGVLEDGAYFGIYAREDYVDAFVLRRLDENLEVVQTCGVDERHFAHADDSYNRFVAHCGAHQFIEPCCDTEEERAVDFIYLYAV